MKGTFCTNILQITKKYTVYHPDRKRLTFDEYILFEGQSIYYRICFYINLIHLRNG
jgi:hypothetical protein